MIQRIQTLYLFVSFILMLMMFFFPLAELLPQGGETYTFRFDGLYYQDSTTIYYQAIPPIILLSVITLLNFITIFLYKRRIIQMRISFINILLMLGYVGLLYFYVSDFSNRLEAETVSYRIFDVFPVAAAILTYLAIRAIGKDEALIRSIDRIR